MTRYLQIVETPNLPTQRQARQLYLYAKQLHGDKRFPRNAFLRHLDSVDPTTVLENSRAIISNTWDYYQATLNRYGFLRIFEDDTEIKSSSKFDAFHRAKRSSTTNKQILELQSKLAILEELLSKKPDTDTE